MSNNGDGLLHIGGKKQLCIHIDTKKLEINIGGEKAPLYKRMSTTRCQRYRGNRKFTIITHITRTEWGRYHQWMQKPLCTRLQRNRSWRNLADITFPKYVNLTSNLVTTPFSSDALRQIQPVWYFAEKNIYPESKCKETITEIQSWEHYVKWLAWVLNNYQLWKRRRREGGKERN